MGGAFKAYGGRRVACWVWWGDLKETGHLEDLGVDGSCNIITGLRKMGWRVWTGLIWLKIETGGRHV
jgi:hypothetical protein